MTCLGSVLLLLLLLLAYWWHRHRRHRHCWQTLVVSQLLLLLLLLLWVFWQRCPTSFSLSLLELTSEMQIATVFPLAPLLHCHFC